MRHDKWQWRPVYDRLLAPSLQNGNSDVRTAATQAIVKLNQLVGGNEIHGLIQSGTDVKPNVQQKILELIANPSTQVKQPPNHAYDPNKKTY